MIEAGDLFDGELAPVEVPRRRPAGVDPPAGQVDGGQPEFFQVEPGRWVVVVFALSPKQGWFENWRFPLYWGPHAWIASIDDRVPDGVHLWASRADAAADLADCYPTGERFRPYPQRFPSRDQRSVAQRKA